MLYLSEWRLKMLPISSGTSRISPCSFNNVQNRGCWPVYDMYKSMHHNYFLEALGSGEYFHINHIFALSQDITLKFASSGAFRLLHDLSFSLWPTM